MNNRTQQLFEQLRSALESERLTLDDLDKRQGMLEADERGLGVRLNAVAKREQQQEGERGKLDAARKFLDTWNTKLARQQAQLDTDKREVATIERQRKELGEQQVETQRLLDQLSKETQALGALKKLEGELEQRERKVKREIVIDRERKRILDLRVERIKQREQQLQLDRELGDL